MMFLRASMEAEYSCGGLDLVFSGTFPYMVSMVILIIKIAVPILLVIFGMLDLGKAIIASKEDEIKKGQQTLIKRVIAAAIVFFVIQITQIIVRFAAGDSTESIMGCFNCFVNGDVKDGACEEHISDY